MGTHPIFESDFDCLTECIVLCCYSRVKAKSGYKNGSTQLPTRIVRKCRVILSILYYSVDQKCQILLISWATKLSINDMLRSTFAALWIKMIMSSRCWRLFIDTLKPWTSTLAPCVNWTLFSTSKRRTLFLTSISWLATCRSPRPKRLIFFGLQDLL